MLKRCPTIGDISYNYRLLPLPISAGLPLFYSKSWEAAYFWVVVVIEFFFGCRSVCDSRWIMQQLEKALENIRWRIQDEFIELQQHLTHLPSSHTEFHKNWRHKDQLGRLIMWDVSFCRLLAVSDILIGKTTWWQLQRIRKWNGSMLLMRASIGVLYRLIIGCRVGIRVGVRWDGNWLWLDAQDSIILFLRWSKHFVRVQTEKMNATKVGSRYLESYLLYRRYDFT